MKFFKILIIITLFCSASAFSQKIIKHKIKSGESIYGLALKYDLTEKEMYAANPKTKGALLQLGQVVNIPNKKYKEKVKPTKKEKKEQIAEKKEKKEILVDEKLVKEALVAKKEEFITHVVTSKETLYSISKKYGVTMETICEMNPELKTSNLKKGAKLKIPNDSQETSTVDNKEVVENDIQESSKVDLLNTYNGVIHKVLPKETLFRISKQYGVSVADLQKLNPGIENGLPVGYDLILKKEGAPIVKTETSETVVDEAVVAKNIPAGNLAKAEFLIEKASQHLGTRYRSGGTTSAGFDCSGLMFNTFQNLNVTLPRSSPEMANYGVRIDKAHAQKGDLIFFATFGGRRISHVGMITEVTPDGEIKFIHSATSSGVIVSSVSEPYYTRTFVQINRVITD
jgi:cell wall-associated NlpC family hydrolase